MEIESDSLAAINIINDDDEMENHPERIFIENSRKLKEEVKAQIWHVLRKANRCAVKMAKLRRSQREQLVRVLIPPDDVIEDLIADMVGVSYPRGN